MKSNLPSIFLNPNKYEYSLNDIEIGYFQDAKKDLIKKYYNLVSKSIWKAILSNLKRRIEFYGTNNFIENLDENEQNIYFRNSYTLSEKLSLIDNIVIIKTCLKLNIISGKVYTILIFYYWFNKNTSNEPILYEDIIAIVKLLEKNFFKLEIDYKVPEFYTQSTKKSKINIPEEKRRKDDFVNTQDLTRKRRKNDYINTQTKKIKKEDLFIMQKSTAPRRRQNDFMQVKDPLLKRRKDDLEYTNELIGRRRKEDLIPEENQFIPRKRRKNDYTNNITVPNPRRRRKED